MTEAVGGYFSLELAESNKHYSENNTIALNTARNCLEYIIRVRKYELMYIPYFTCEVILEPLNKLGIAYEFYDVNDYLEPIFDFGNILERQGFLYTNYFGIKDQYISTIATQIPNLIIDNAQSLFSLPIKNVDTFYSPRKFVGVADGGFLSINAKLQSKFAQDISYDRVSHLLKRIDLSAEEGYNDFCVNDKSLQNQPIKHISKLTAKILAGVDCDLIKKRRKENFDFLHKALNKKNNLIIGIVEDSIPMVYPFRTKNFELKTKLIRQKIYCATYWPNVFAWAQEDKYSYLLAKEIIALPIDQRYGEKEMQIIVDVING